MVRMGHLAWDSYEPPEEKFDFGWFDTVMDMMNKAGIKVILDIAIRPAPIWLHVKYSSIDITDASGNRDVGDPMYQKYALIYADSITKHYAKYPGYWLSELIMNRMMVRFLILKGIYRTRACGILASLPITNFMFQTIM